MRHYLEIRDGKVGRSTISTFTIGRCLPLNLAKLDDLEDGLYRARVYADPRVRLVVGGKCKSFSHEADRLQKQQDNRATAANTASPGIGGCQHAADASTARLMNLSRETVKVIKWLKGENRIKSHGQDLP